MKNPSFHPTLNRLLAGCGVTPRHVTSFDSSTVLLAALASFLRGEDFAVGPRGRLTRAAARAALCALPGSARTWAYRMGARADAVPSDALRAFRSETTSRWVTAQYPRRRYPVVLLGSSNGAAIHLASALRAPWLPQNQLVLVRTDGLDPDEPQRSMSIGRAVAGPLLAAAPDLQLHQMQDPVQDRLMTREVLYFRLKRLELGPAYERFLLDRLEPGGTLVVVDCKSPWPCVEVAERHHFQLGGIGALQSSDYTAGGPGGREFLESQGASRTRWDVPSPGPHRSSHLRPEQGAPRAQPEAHLRMQPEAEWGYAPQLTSDVIRFAERHGYRVERLTFEDPEDLSPWVADLFRERVVRSCGAPDRLVIESFFLTDPWCMQRTGSVPFWTTFNAEPSACSVERYLDGARAFDDIRAALFSSGVDAPHTASPERWRSILKRARNDSGFLGVRVDDYPADFGVYLRYHDAWSRLPDAPRPPVPLGWSDVRAYASDREAEAGATGKNFPVRLELLHE